VEQVGAGSGTEGGEPGQESALDVLHASEGTPNSYTRWARRAARAPGRLERVGRLVRSGQDRKKRDQGDCE
jgi:hypothetical protein